MPASLAFDDYLDAINTAAARLREDTLNLPEEQFVPTCREWSALQLIAHTGMVHRWAAGIVSGTLNRDNVDAATEEFQDEGMQQPDPGAWLLAGADNLTRVLQSAPDDLDVFFFLNDAPAPKLAWARRQCHETTIHAFDALAARLGQIPSSHDADLDIAVALDGIDELLRGFAARRHEELRTSRPVSVVIEATDAQQTWTVRLSAIR